MQPVKQKQVRYEAIKDDKVIHATEKTFEYTNTINLHHLMRKFVKDQSEKLKSKNINFFDSVLIVKSNFE